MKNREDRKNSPFEERKKFCPFSQPNSPQIDYKDVKLLTRYISEKGKIIPSRITNVSNKKQKELAQIKAANLLNKDYSPSRSIQELQKEIFKQSDDFSFEKQNSFGLAQGMYYISKLLEA